MKYFIVQQQQTEILRRSQAAGKNLVSRFMSRSMLLPKMSKEVPSVVKMVSHGVPSLSLPTDAHASVGGYKYSTTLTRVGLATNRTFYTRHIPADCRIGPHSKLFNEILTGFMLGDGWLEKHGNGARLGISLIHKFKDVADWYQKTLYFLGYMANPELPLIPLIRGIRKKVSNQAPYYQLRTFTFKSFLSFYDT